MPLSWYIAVGGSAIALSLPAYATTPTVDRGLNDWFLSLVFFAAGGIAAWLWHYFREAQKSELSTNNEETAIADIILSSPKSAFYYKNLNSGEEWFSSALIELVGVSGKKPQFTDLKDIFGLEGYERLKQAIIDLRAGQAGVRIEIATPTRAYECIGSALEYKGTRHVVVYWHDIAPFHKQVSALKHENDRVKKEARQMTNLLNALPFPIWMRDESLAIKYCNLAHMKACEEKSDQGGQDALELYLQSKQLAKKAVAADALTKERRHIVIQGDRRLHDIIEIPWKDETTCTAGIAYDLTEMDEVQRELERIKSAQQDLLEGTTSAMAIYGADMRLQFYNNSFATLWKLEEEWLRSQPTYSDILEKLRENRSLPEQANFPAYKQQHLKLFTDLIEPNEEFFYLPDGRTIRVLAIPHTFGGVLFAYEDVTDRLALERSYNTLIAVQKETLDNLHEGVAVFGEDGRLKLSNLVYRQMWGLSQETLQSQPHVNDLLDRNKRLTYYQDWEEFKRGYIAQMQRREVSQQQFERKDGKVFNLIMVPLPDGQTLLNYVDVTDSIFVERSLREKNEALEEADRVKSEFLANISYELRSPLTSISGFSEMLKMNYFGELNEQQFGYIENIEQASKHLSSLIDDILDIASIEAGYMQLDIKKMDVHSVLGTMQRLVGERAKDNNITLTMRCDENIGMIDADSDRIRQVIYNLLINAIKYTDSGGEVILGAKEDDSAEHDGIIIWVQDDGIGIPEDEHEAVFTKFYRSNGAKKRQSSGTGLGLSMVKSFIELHGGYVTLHSQPGEGTTVQCHLPRVYTPQQ